MTQRDRWKVLPALLLALGVSTAWAADKQATQPKSPTAPKACCTQEGSCPACAKSKVYYIVTDSAGFGEQVVRLPVTGNETVLDALGQIGGLSAQASQQHIWVARPAPVKPGCAKRDAEQILPVDWNAIVMCGETATNYQLLPGDRVYVKAQPLIARDNTPSKSSTCCAESCAQAKKTKPGDIQRQLGKPVASLHFKETPLRQVLDELQGWAGINIVADLPALSEAGIGLDRPVTLKLEGVTLKSALNLLLHQAHLTYVVKDDVLQVTTEEQARGKLVTKIHPVADLVFTPDDEAEPDPLVVANGLNLFFNFTLPPKPAEASKQPATPEDQLIQLITRIVCPESWNCMGGQGAIEFFPLGPSLVVNQRPEVQEQIADLLQALRRSRAEATPMFAPPPGLPPLPAVTPLPPAPAYQAAGPMPPPPCAPYGPATGYDFGCPIAPSPSVAEHLPPPRVMPATMPCITEPVRPPASVLINPLQSFPALLPCTATESACPTWHVRAVTDKGKTRLEMRNESEVIQATCESLDLWHMKDHLSLSTANKQMRVHGPHFKALADSLQGSSATGWTLSGHVVFEYEKDGVSAQVRGEQVTVGLKDGHLEVIPGTRPAETAVKRMSLGQVLNGVAPTCP